MEPLKNVKELQEELLATVNGQIAIRRYLLDEMVGSLYPRIVQAELDQLEALKEQILKLGEST